MATYQLQLRKNKTNREKKHPIIFKIYLGNKNKIITLPFNCNVNEWDETNKKFRKNYPKYKQINELLRNYEIKLQSVIDELETQEIDYDLQDIKNAFNTELNQNKVKTTTVSEFMLHRVKELQEESKFGYAKGIKDTHASLFKFAKNDLKFKQITPEFLDKYEHYLRKSYTDGGIAFRMRDIRTIYNRAIRHGYAKQLDYPFKSYKISKLKSNSRKIAITKEDLELFKTFDFKKYPSYETTYKMFLFSYYAGGMNFKDMTFLKWVNTRDNRLVYKRDKTKGEFNLKLYEEAIKIIEHFKGFPKSENVDYVFPIIHKYNLTDKQINGRYKRCIKKFNKQLKFIAEIVGIEKNITSYVARHSFATHLKFNGVSESLISQLMGHSSEAVTKAYLQDFGSDVLDEALSNLN